MHAIRFLAILENGNDSPLQKIKKSCKIFSIISIEEFYKIFAEGVLCQKSK